MELAFPRLGDNDYADEDAFDMWTRRAEAIDFANKQGGLPNEACIASVSAAAAAWMEKDWESFAAGLTDL